MKKPATPEHKYIVRMQSAIPIVINGWREVRITRIKARAISTLDDAIDYAIAGYIDTNAESHYAVISESPGKFTREIRYGTAITGFRKPTLPSRDVG